MTKIVQYHAGTHPRDAITNGMLLLAERLGRIGLAGRVTAGHVHRELAGRIERFSAAAAGPDDVLLVHHSADNPLIDEVLAAPCRKILVYHNITKPAFFGPGEEEIRRSVVDGYAQLGRLRAAVDGALCDSAFNARALVERGFRDVEPLCLLADFEGLPDRPHLARPYRHRDDVFHVLFVGRICGNKGQHHLVRAVPAIERAVGRRVRLTLCGHADHGRGHLRRIRDEIRRLGLGDRVALVGSVPDEDLHGLYRDADAYVSYSRHEGFGVPLVEAMAFGVPVFALAAAAVPETLGGAGRLLESLVPDELAGAIADVFRTRSGLRAFVRRQRARAAELSIDRTLPKLLAFLDRRHGLGLSAALPPAPRPSPGRQILVEGPAAPAGAVARLDDGLARAVRAFAATPVREARRLDDDGPVPAATGGGPLSIAAPSVGLREAAAPSARGQVADLRLQWLACDGSRLPAWLVRQVNARLDGVVVSGRHGAKVCRDSGVRVPVAVIAPGRTAPPAAPPRPAPAPFVVLHVASGRGDEGTDDLLKAHLAAFGAADDVVLVVVAGADPANGVPALVDSLRAGRPDAARVVVDTAEPTPARLDDLCRAADVVVPPTGGPVVEAVAAAALAAGRPLLVPATGARFDVPATGVAVAVRSRFVAADAPDAEPGSHRVAFDPLDLARVLRSVVAGGAGRTAGRERRREEGKVASEDIATFVDRLEAPRPQKACIRLAAIARHDARPAGDVEAIAGAFPVGPNHVEHWDVRAAAGAVTPPRPSSPRTGDFEALCRRAVDERFDAVLVAHDPAAVAADAFFRGLAHLRAHRVVVHVVLDEVPADDAARAGFLRDHAADLAAVDRVFVPTLADLDRLAGHGVHDGVTLLPRVVPVLPPLSRDGLRAALDLPADGPVVVCAGPPSPGRGLPALIEAFALIRWRFPQARLVLATPIPPDPEARRLAATCRDLIALHGLADRVAPIDDPLADEQVDLLCAAADLVVVPGAGPWAETNAAVRRALAARRPVLALGADLAEDVAPVVLRAEPDDREALAEAMLALLGSETRLAEAGARAAAFVRGRTARDAAEIVVGNVEQDVMRRDGVERPLFALRDGSPASARASATVLGRRRTRELLAGLLGREPTIGEVAGIDVALAAGVPLGRAVDELIASGEYFEAVHATPRLLAALRLPGVDLADLRRLDGRDFVEACYREILGRPGDEGGIGQFMRVFARADAASAKRIVVEAMMASPEYRDAVVPRIVVDSAAGAGS